MGNKKNNNSSTRDSFFNRIKEPVKDLPPAYFTMVMSTGIISISHYMLKINVMAYILFWLNVWFYISLWILTLLRIIFYPKEFLKNLIDHQEGSGFFTIVASSCILGSQFIIIFDNYSFALWIIGIVLWVILNYTIFTSFTVKENKSSLDQGITGAWLAAFIGFARSVFNQFGWLMRKGEV